MKLFRAISRMYILTWIGLGLTLIGTTGAAVNTSKASDIITYLREVGPADNREGQKFIGQLLYALQTARYSSYMSGSGLVLILAGMTFKKRLQIPE